MRKVSLWGGIQHRLISAERMAGIQTARKQGACEPLSCTQNKLSIVVVLVVLVVTVTAVPVVAILFVVAVVAVTVAVITTAAVAVVTLPTAPIAVIISATAVAATGTTSVKTPVATAAITAAAPIETTAASAVVRAVFFGRGFLYKNRPALKFTFVQCLNGLVGFTVLRHFYKTETLGFAGGMVHDDLGGRNLPEPFKCGTKIVAGRIEIQLCNKNIHTQNFKNEIKMVNKKREQLADKVLNSKPFRKQSYAAMRKN